MKLSQFARGLLFTMTLFLFAGCTPTINQTPESTIATTDTGSSAKIISAFSDLPIASSTNKGQLYYIIEESKFYYSDGVTWVVINLTGTTGATGAPGSSLTIYTQNTVISKSQGDYNIIGNFIVAPGVTLTIDKGVHVFVYPNSGLYIEGNLLITGNLAEKVVLKSYFSGNESTGRDYICFGLESTSNIQYAEFNNVDLKYTSTETKSHIISYTKFIDDGIGYSLPLKTMHKTNISINHSSFIALSTPSSSYPISVTYSINMDNCIIDGYSTGIYSEKISNVCNIINTSFNNCGTAISMYLPSVSLVLSGNNYISITSKFLSISTIQNVDMKGSYFDGLSGVDVTNKISAVGSSVDISGIVPSANIITGCGW